MQSPVLSIIVPTFNSGHTIRNCLESIINEKFKLVEIIIVDGLSSDETIEILKEYSFNYPAIKYYSENDDGIYDAMNKGINLSKGKWIYFLGSDDFLANDQVFNTVFNLVNIDEYDLVYGNVYLGNNGEKYDGEFDRIKLMNRNICHQAILYKRNLFNKLGFYKIKYELLADWEFNIRCFFTQNVKIKYIDTVVATISTGGKSTRLVDYKFYRDKNIILLKQGYSYFTWNKIMSLFIIGTWDNLKYILKKSLRLFKIVFLSL